MLASQTRCWPTAWYVLEALAWWHNPMPSAAQIQHLLGLRGQHSAVPRGGLVDQLVRRYKLHEIT